jgi:8-oxo-dGTP diphosphatase
MSLRNAQGEIRAAGGIVLEVCDREPRILMVHRPRFGDWTLPRGKVKHGETDEGAALREVTEESGLACYLDCEVGQMHYRDRKGRAKLARYWIMRPQSGQFACNTEVDEIAWLNLAAASRRATRSGEAELLSRLASSLRVEFRGDLWSVISEGPIVVHETSIDLPPEP